MNQRPDDREFEDFLAGKSDLTEAYRRLAHVEPSPDVDARILAEARKAAASPRRSPWWRRAPAFAMVGLLAAGLSVMVLRESPDQMPKTLSMPVTSTPGRAADTLPVPTAPSRTNAPRDRESRADTTAETIAAPQPVGVGVGVGEDAREGPDKPAGEAAPSPAAGPSDQADLGLERQKQQAAEPRAMPEDAAAEEPGPELVGPGEGRQTRYKTAPANMPSAATGNAAGAPAAVRYPPAGTAAALQEEDAAGPERRQEVFTLSEPPPAEEWLSQIETLVDEGHLDRARTELLRFRDIYPEHELPENLIELLPAEDRSP